MTNEMNSYKRELGVKWVKAESGNTYLCSLNALRGIESPSEEQLKNLCVNESHDPHNQ